MVCSVVRNREVAFAIANKEEEFVILEKILLGFPFFEQTVLVNIDQFELTFSLV
jgi:hypothetical protein